MSVRYFNDLVLWVQPPPCGQTLIVAPAPWQLTHVGVAVGSERM